MSGSSAVGWQYGSEPGVRHGSGRCDVVSCLSFQEGDGKRLGAGEVVVRVMLVIFPFRQSRVTDILPHPNARPEVRHFSSTYRDRPDLFRNGGALKSATLGGSPRFRIGG